jgi:hypothetical protein
MRQTVKSLVTIAAAMSVLASAVSSAGAAPVLIVNAGFEAATLDDSQAIFTLDGWVNSGDSGTFDPHAAAFAAGAPEGDNVAFASHGGPTISQVLDATAQANTLYTLTILVGNRLDADFGGYQTGLWAGGMLLAQDNGTQLPADGQFLLSTVQYFIAADDAAVGLPIEIRLSSLGWQTVFDDVRLDSAEQVPEPALLALIGLGVGETVRRRRRQAGALFIRASLGRMMRAKVAQSGERVGHRGPTPRAPSCKIRRIRAQHCSRAGRAGHCPHRSEPGRAGAAGAFTA